MSSEQPQNPKTIVRNSLFSVSTWLLPLFTGLVATPILVHSLGADSFGVYALLLGVISYTFNVNTGRAVTKYIAEYRQTDRTDLIADVVSATFWMNLLIVFSGGLVMVLTAPFLVGRVLGVSELLRESAIVGFYVVAVIIVGSMQLHMFNAVLQGYQRFDSYSVLALITGLLNSFGNIGLALAGFGFVALLVWNVVIIAASCLLVGIAAHQLLPRGWFWRRPKASTIKLLISFNSAIISYQLIANAIYMFERAWIVRELGEAALTHYSVQMNLALYFHGFVTGLLVVVFPLSSELATDRERLQRLYIAATKVALTLDGVFVAVMVSGGGHEFLRLWMHDAIPVSAYGAVGLLAAAFAVAALFVVPWSLVDGVGHPSYNLKFYLICFVVSVVLIVLLTKQYGVAGPAAARLAGFASLLVSVPFIEKWFLGETQWRFWLKSIFAIGLSGVLAGLTMDLLISYAGGGWLRFFLISFAAITVYLVCLILTGFLGREEKLIAMRVLGRVS